jgi:hypothetical protein
MRLKDLMEATFRSTMVSIHEHAMQLQASQSVPPPAIPPPPCRKSDLYETLEATF